MLNAVMQRSLVLVVMGLCLAGCPAPDARLNQPTATAQRYEDLMPYNPSWWEQLVNPSGAREDYLAKAQAYNARQAQIATAQAQIPTAQALTTQEQNCQTMGMMAAELAELRDQHVPLLSFQERLVKSGDIPDVWLEVTKSMGTAIYATPSL